MAPTLYPLSASNAAYLARVQAVLSDPGHAEVIAPWLTKVCPECEQVPPPGDRFHGVVDTPIGRYVAIGCEFYHVIFPVMLGLEPAKPSAWIDWHLSTSPSEPSSSPNPRRPL